MGSRHLLLLVVAVLATLTGAGLFTSSAYALPDAHLRGSKAIPPKGAPPVVKKMIKAGNAIRHKKYKWGGGHRSWRSKGYDCSGAVSYVLYRAGVLDYPLDSRGFMKWGQKRKGKWISIYASKEHVYMVVAGLRFDTSYITDGDKSGPGWSEYMRPSKGFRTRHPTRL